MSITFAVDDVEPAAAPLPTRDLSTQMGPHQALGADPGACVEAPDVHPLLGAVHVAFAQHRPLALSPDTIWLTIAQGVGLHVRLNAEALRPRLVRHHERQRLAVEFDGTPTSAEDWTHVVGDFRAAVTELVGDGQARLLTCNFSTTTLAAAVASEIALMDVYAPYFAYEVMCVCGIPEITLLGTVEDWSAIRQRIDVIAELDLGFWTRSLAPIADQLVATAEGRPNLAFWQDIYKPRAAYGADRVTGWIARLFPYVKRGGYFDERNPLLSAPLGELHPQEPGWNNVPGITPDSVPRGTSQVLVHLLDRGAGGGNRDVILEGGLLGVAQDGSGCLAPVPGWVARPSAVSTAVLVERLRAGPHQIEDVEANARMPFGPLEIVTLFGELRAATLFPGPGAWRLRPVIEHESIEVPVVPGRTFPVERILDLPDATTVALAWLDSGRRFVRLRVGDLGPAEPPRYQGRGVMEGAAAQRSTAQCAAEVPILDGTLTSILARALDTGGAIDLALSGQTLFDVVDDWHRTPPPPEEQLRVQREVEQAARTERRRAKAARQEELRARLTEAAETPKPDPNDKGSQPS